MKIRFALMLVQAVLMSGFIAWATTQGYAIGFGLSFEMIALYTVSVMFLHNK